MKILKYLLSLTVISMIFFSSCKIDNFGPNATFYGAIRDSVNGGLVETTLTYGNVLEVFELGYPTQVSQSWVIKENGEFRNNLVFANKYDIYLRNENFFPYTLYSFEIKPGDNMQDFYVTPYIRIKDCNISLDTIAKKVNATFRLEAGKPSVKLKTISLFSFSDMHVGSPISYKTKGNGFTQTFKTSVPIDTATIYSLSIDLTANPTMFLHGRNYYFRVGALADVTGVGTIRLNYAPYIKITL